MQPYMKTVRQYMPPGTNTHRNTTGANTTMCVARARTAKQLYVWGTHALTVHAPSRFGGLITTRWCGWERATRVCYARLYGYTARQLDG